MLGDRVYCSVENLLELVNFQDGFHFNGKFFARIDQSSHKVLKG